MTSLIKPLDASKQSPEVRKALPAPGSIDDEEASRPLPQHKLHQYTYLPCQQLNSILNADGLYADKLVWVFQHADGSSSRLRPFLRARVVEVLKDGRIFVRYPKKSTYRVRRECIFPVLDKYQRHMILVAPETDIYRRLCLVHTLVDDVFCEIGSAKGDNCWKVYETGGVAQVLGLDKSRECLDTSSARYPAIRFQRYDFYHDSWPPAASEEVPTVVALDINGNRELPAVLDCLEHVLSSDAASPRLIIVKSRTLYQKLMSEA